MSLKDWKQEFDARFEGLSESEQDAELNQSGDAAGEWDERKGWRAIEQARYNYAAYPGWSIAKCFREAGVPPALAYAWRQNGNWDFYGFEYYRKLYQELHAKQEEQRYKRSLVSRIMRNERAALKAEQLLDALRTDNDGLPLTDAQLQSAVEQVSRLIRSIAENNKDFQLLFNKPTGISEERGKLPTDKGELVALLESLQAEAQRRVEEAKAAGDDAN